MTETIQLKLASFAFASLWIAVMWWGNAPQTSTQAIVLAACGALAGLSWYFGYGRWFSCHLGNNSARG